MNSSLPSIIVLSLIAVGCTPSSSGPDDSGEIAPRLVFVASDTSVGPTGLYTAKMDGTDLRPVAVQGDTVEFPDMFGGKRPLAGYELSYPQWNPDYSKIACQLTSPGIDGPGLILVMNSDGADKHVFWNGSSGGVQPHWSPSGKSILYVRSYGYGIVGPSVIMDATSGSESEFTVVSPLVFDGDGIWFQGQFQWGASDDEIFGLGSVNRSLPIEGGAGGGNDSNEVFRLNASDGSVEARLTRNSVDETRFQVSPGANAIAFVRNLDAGSSTFYRIQLAGGTLSEQALSSYPMAWSWAHDATITVFALDLDSDPYNLDSRIFLLNWNDLQLVQLTGFHSYFPDL